MIVVTADHSHTMTIMGYPKRGTDIRGMTGNNATDGLPEPILSYANGKGMYRPREGVIINHDLLMITLLVKFT